MALSCDIFFVYVFLMTFVTTKEELENNVFFLHYVHARQIFFNSFVLFFCDEIRHFYRSRQEILGEWEKKPGQILNELKTDFFLREE